MGDRERTNGSGKRWYAGYPRATVHQVAVEKVPANEYVPEVTENAGYSMNVSRKPEHETIYKPLKAK